MNTMQLETPSYISEPKARKKIVLNKAILSAFYHNRYKPKNIIIKSVNKRKGRAGVIYQRIYTIWWSSHL
jgi:hypothetical protein